MPKRPSMPERPPSFDHCAECGKIVGDFRGWFGPQCMCKLPPGDALSYSAQLMEIARRTGHSNLFPPEAAASIEKPWDEIRRTRSQPSVRLPTLAELRAAPGLIWPVVNGRETRRRYRQGSDPAVDRVRGEFDFYGHADHRAWIWLRPYQPPRPVTHRGTHRLPRSANTRSRFRAFLR